MLKLTKQELAVYQLLATGATSKQIAAKLYVSKRTVDFHRSNLFDKARASGFRGTTPVALVSFLSTCGVTDDKGGN